MKTYKIKVNKPIVTLDEIELTEDQVKDLIEQYNKPTHKRKYFVPKLNERYWYINFYNGIESTSYFPITSKLDEQQIKVGNCFATEQDAQDELNRRQALVRIWSDYDDKYSWDIDWGDVCQLKFPIVFNHIMTNDFYAVSNGIYQQHTELPYFKSAEDRNQFVEANRDDLLIIFNIKK